MQALKEAGCDEVVLAINYQPKVVGIFLRLLYFASDTLEPLPGLLPGIDRNSCAGDDGLPQGVGGEAGHQNYVLASESALISYNKYAHGARCRRFIAQFFAVQHPICILRRF